MNIITEADYRKLIGKTAGRAFLFFGEEDYLKAYDIKATREQICPDPAFAIFNDVTLDAIDYSADRLLDAMTPPPMMGDERLIVLRGLDFTALSTEELDALVETLALLSEYDYNTVIIHAAAGLLDEGYLPKKPSATLQKLGTVTTPVQFPVSTPAKLCAWAAKHFQHLGVQAAPAACQFLIEYAGKSMYLLANEIEKIAYYVLENGRNAVTEADIRLCAVAARDLDNFAFSNAILAGRTADALEAFSLMKFDRTPPTMILGELAKTVCDMQAAKFCTDAGKSQKELAAIVGCHEYRAGLLIKAVSRLSHERLARAVTLCADADAALKRAATDYAPIEKLICSL